MPFLDEKQYQYVGFPTQQVVTPKEDYDFWTEVVPAGFRQENTLWSTYTNGIESQVSEQATSDPNFDPMRDIPKEHELYASRYAWANNEDDVVRIKEQIDNELQARKILDESGGEGIAAALMAGLIDPINLIPIGGAAYKGYKAGDSVLKGAATLAKVGALSSTLAETLLHGTQETRTTEETALNITGATLLSGVLGAGVSALGKNFSDISRIVDNDLRVEPDITKYPDRSAGAAEVGRSLEEEGIYTNKAVDLVFKKLGISRLDPIGRTITSGAVTTRRTVQKLAEVPEILAKNVTGDASPENVYRAVQNWKNDMATAMLDLDDLYVQYVKGRSKHFGDIATIGAKRMVGLGDNTKMTYRQFREEIGKAMRRGDVHNIPEVAKAAKNIREKVYEPLKNEAVQRGLLGEDLEPTTAVSYLNRVYNVQKLRTAEGRQAFLDRTVAWLGRKVSEAKAKTDEVTPRDEYYADLTDAELLDIAQDILHQIQGTPIGRLAGGTKGVQVNRPSQAKTGATAKQLKSRTFLIPDEEIEEFLENDVELLMSHYVRSMAPDVEMARIFDGDIDLKDTLDSIRKEWENMKDKPKNWQKMMDNDLRDLVAMRDRIKGIYAMPENPESIFHRSVAGIRKLNYVTLLGGMQISAIPDLARPFMVNGFRNSFGDLILPLMRDFGRFKLAKKEMTDLGAAVEYVMSSRAASIGDVMDETARYTRVERGLGAISDTFGAVSLMGPWNATLKQITGIMTSQRLVRAIKAEAKGKISNKERTFLRANGIDESSAKSLLAQIEKHGDVDGDITLTNWGNWDDMRLKRQWQSAINRQLDLIVITPGEDVPLTASGGGAAGELGRMALQFKRFGFAANHRLLVAGLQNPDKSFFSGLLLSVTLGMLVSKIKSTNSDINTDSWDVDKWLVEGVDRSGVTGIFMDVNNIAEKMSRGHIGLSALVDEQASRYQSRNVVGALVGPSFGTASQIMTATGNAFDVAFSGEDWRATDTKTIRRLLPYQNLWYLRGSLNQLEQSINETIGAKQ